MQSYRNYLTTKTLKTNGFDTIEIDIVQTKNGEMDPIGTAPKKKGTHLLTLPTQYYPN
jgi:hypothetical protein